MICSVDTKKNVSADFLRHSSTSCVPRTLRALGDETRETNGRRGKLGGRNRRRMSLGMV